MGLLDSVISAAGSMMGGQQQEGGGLGALLPAVVGMLSNDSQLGGLGGLLERFNSAGLGEVAKSWVGTGENASITGEQISQVLGGDMLGKLAGQLGMNEGDAAGSLAQMLPGLIDKLTPNGSAPEGGLGNAAELMGMLGGLFGKR